MSKLRHDALTLQHSLHAKASVTKAHRELSQSPIVMKVTNTVGC